MEFRAGPFTGPGGSVPPKSMEGALWEAIASPTDADRRFWVGDAIASHKSPPTGTYFGGRP